MIVAGIEIELVQKNIKNLHLAVYPPDGRVRLAAPKDVNEKTLELYVTSKIPWIRQQQRKFERQDRQTQRQFIDGESHYFLGKRYMLRVHESDHPFKYPKVVIKSRTHIEMYVKKSFTVEQKSELLKEWYRKQLKMILAELMPKWEGILGVTPNNVKVQTLKTKWGSCNTDNGNILFNIELAKKPFECIEYVVLHELLHLIERTHGDIFTVLLDKHMPNWRYIREELNSLPIGHEDWSL